ncbi:conserved exported protein of unknown function [Cyanobium sp. NIES-981]|nr:conserved exported protein of unknown function [Cyanobium sp. NIES-981]
MGKRLVGTILALWLLLTPAAAGAAQASPDGALEARMATWPDWSLPAPLPRPGRRDLLYPAWFQGRWRACDEAGRVFELRFLPVAGGAVAGDRAFNARAIGAAMLGKALLAVENDPANPNRQVARLWGPQGRVLQLESTVVARGSAQPSPDRFLADELALQVLHGPGAPRISRVEVLSSFERRSDGAIAVEQWQATYPAPGEGLTAAAASTERHHLQLDPLRPDPSEAAELVEDAVAPLEQGLQQGMVGHTADAMARQGGTGAGREAEHGQMGHHGQISQAERLSHQIPPTGHEHGQMFEVALQLLPLLDAD